jgi:hypothetical protein
MAQLDTVVRPAAIISEVASRSIAAHLEKHDVQWGGMWSAGINLWQRYDHHWDGPSGMRGTAKLVGTIHVIHDQPHKYYVTLYRVQVTEHGVSLGFTVDSLADELLSKGGLTLATCPRDQALQSFRRDPFHVPQRTADTT